MVPEFSGYHQTPDIRTLYWSRSSCACTNGANDNRRHRIDSIFFPGFRWTVPGMVNANRRLGLILGPFVDNINEADEPVLSLGQLRMGLQLSMLTVGACM